MIFCLSHLSLAFLFLQCISADGNAAAPNVSLKNGPPDPYLVPRLRHGYRLEVSGYREPYMTKDDLTNFMMGYAYPNILDFAMSGDGASGPFAIYCALPHRVANQKIAWELAKFDGQAPSHPETVFSLDMVSWIELLVIVIQKWTDVDWIPTFDMLLTDYLQHNFKGSISVAR